MRLWRIVSERHLASALSGMGGLIVGGRWHHKGTLIVYASSTPSLAALEALVHVDPSLAPSNLQLVEVFAPDDLPTETLSDPSILTPEWRSSPPPIELADFGSAWVTEARTPLLRVPSAVSVVGGDVESNVLLNPSHPLASLVHVASARPFSFDPRLVS